jgi:hypothetical protein
VYVSIHSCGGRRRCQAGRAAESRRRAWRRPVLSARGHPRRALRALAAYLGFAPTAARQTRRSCRIPSSRRRNRQPRRLVRSACSAWVSLMKIRSCRRPLRRASLARLVSASPLRFAQDTPRLSCGARPLTDTLVRGRRRDAGSASAATVGVDRGRALRRSNPFVRPALSHSFGAPRCRNAQGLVKALQAGIGRASHPSTDVASPIIVSNCFSVIVSRYRGPARIVGSRRPNGPSVRTRDTAARRRFLGFLERIGSPVSVLAA